MNVILNLFGYRFKKKTETEYSSPCPKTGYGEDRFVLFSDGHWMCRKGCPDCGCNKRENQNIAWGRPIDYLIQFEHMTYAEAVKIVESDSNYFSNSSNTNINKSNKFYKSKKQQIFKNEVYPDEVWQKAAMLFVDCTSQYILNSKEGIEYVEKRGINIDTCKKLKIGWMPKDEFFPVEEWGFKSELNKKLFIPKGLVLPTFRRGNVVSITIRRPEWNNECQYPKYHQIRTSGSGELFYISGEISKPIFMCEGIIDAILMYQDSNSEYMTIAENGATKTPSYEVINVLKKAPIVFLSYDTDETGTKAVHRYLEYKSINAAPYRVPMGKDPGEYRSLVDDHNLCNWMKNGIKKYQNYIK